MHHGAEVEGEGQEGSVAVHEPLVCDRAVPVPQDCRPRSFLIGCIGVSGKTKWDVLDGVVRRLFKVSGCRVCELQFCWGSGRAGLCA